MHWHGITDLYRLPGKKLKVEERENVMMWAEATTLISVADTSQDVEFLSLVIDNNNTVPVILTDESDSIISARNFDSEKMIDPRYLNKQLGMIKENNNRIVIDLEDNHFNLIYYKDSTILTMLMYYPYIQLGIILLFILVSYLAFSSSRKAEQNQLWVGMSRETAHQLGTPTSSLAGWIEVLQLKHPEVSITKELALDVERLEKVTERFSRIGSKPSLTDENVVLIILRTIEYLKSRTSSKVKFSFEHGAGNSVIIPLNSALFEWVIENVFKNAIDSMEGSGELNIKLTETDKNAIIDISDTGKGIPKSAFKKIFNPGFTTKQRGWGLGLSLAKRIIEEYHRGRIFVRTSELEKGSCIRIVMNKGKY
ncbi:MAG: ATP-binding protein [Bacteroidales bacterium]|nr:ATP-binding protein [Bacteroidales bacterium]